MVTGGSGFIGSHLVNLLLEKDYDVVVMDRQAPPSSDIKWVQGDLRWIGDCDRAMRDVDAVLHLAARISVDESLDYAYEYFSDNVLSTINVLRVSKQRGVSHFIYTSSCEVYSDINVGAATETHPCNPISPYAVSKYAAERIALAFGKAYNLKVTVIRPFNTFGERQKAFRAGSVIPTFIISALQGKPLVIHGNGSQIRDYVYVRDIAEAHLKVLEGDYTESAIFNVATGKGITIREIAEKVKERIGSAEIKYVEDPCKAARLIRSVGDATKIRSTLGWAPKWSFDKALDRVVRYYKSLNTRFYS